MTTAKNVLDRARKEIGTKEKPTNRTKYGQWYGLDGNAWCAMFVSWVFFNAGMPLSFSTKKGFSWCKAGVAGFKKRKQWYRSNPKPGDVVFYSYRPGHVNHVGIVESVGRDGSIITIEGNYSDQVKRVKRTRQNGLIKSVIGYGRPKYSTAKLGIQAQKPDQVFVWYQDSTVGSGSNKDPDQVKALPYVLAAGKKPEDVVGMAISYGNHVYTWYRDHTVSVGTPTDLDDYKSLYRYTLPAEKMPEDIVGMAIASNGYVYTWYKDSTVSVGTSSNLGKYRQPYPYTLAEGKMPEDIVDIGIGTNDRVYVCYKDYKASTGISSDLDHYQKLYPYALAPGRQPEDIIGIGIARPTSSVPKPPAKLGDLSVNREELLAKPGKPGPEDHINQTGLNLVKHFEGFRAKAYRDPGNGTWTIGYGHTSMAGPPKVDPGDVITKAQGEAILKRDLGKFESSVRKQVKVPLNSNQFSALVSFTYNMGPGNLAKSTLLKRLNRKDYAGAANELLKWVYAGGKKLPGLVRRRKAERALFLKKV